MKPTAIAVVAPSSRMSPEVADRVRALAASLYGADAPRIDFHPQCFAASGHFAGDDDPVHGAAQLAVRRRPGHDLAPGARHKVRAACKFRSGDLGVEHSLERCGAGGLGGDRAHAIASTFCGSADCGERPLRISPIAAQRRPIEM